MTLNIGIVSTYPPTQCGIATFSQALTTHLGGVAGSVGVVRVTDAPEIAVAPVIHCWIPGSQLQNQRAASVLNRCDLALIQHEYGIFGERDGEAILDLVAQLRVPVVTVLHTVLATPTARQHRIFAELCASSDALITMTVMARDRLIDRWDMDPSRVHVIPHGAEVAAPRLGAVREATSRRVLLTWGLLSQGKGIEWALRALASLDADVPRPLYRIVGRTHPRVLEREGEAYRTMLKSLVVELGLEGDVEFDDRYLTRGEIDSAIDRADLVVLPYDSLEQVTSGVLTEAVAAGKPVISTSFPHAVELLASGAGLLVPQGDPHALALAMSTALRDRALTDRMAATAQGLSQSLTWDSVARQYTALGESLVSRRLSVVS